MVSPAVIGFGLAGLAGLVMMHWQERRKIKQMRAAFFSDCLGLFSRYRVVQDPFGYPVLEGCFNGAEIRLEPVLDNVTPRKLPSLWIKVTLLAPVRYRGIFDFMRRPQGTEFYSPASSLDHRVALPAGWPEDSQIATDAPALMPPVEIMSPHMRIFEDPRAKEMLVTRSGVRIVYQVSQAQRAQYAVLRQAVFPENRLRADLAGSLLRAALNLHKAVAA
jgi:hypothetical protein